MVNRHIQGKVIQQDYDDLLATGEGSSLFCLSERTVKLLLATTDFLGWKTRYFSDSDTDIDQDIIDGWQGTVVRELIMSNCCCGDVPFGARLRWTIEGVLQITYDNGETWTDYPEGDGRRNVPEYPTPTPPEGTADKCFAAQNITGNLHEMLDAWIDQLGTISYVASAVDALVALVVPFTGGISVPVAAAIGAIAVAFAEGATAIDTAWSDEAYNEFLCCCLDNIPDSGIVDDETMEAIRDCFRSEVGGLAADILDIVQILEGAIAFANMAKVPSDSGFDCSSCSECEDGCTEDLIDLVGKLENGWPTGYSFVGDHYAINDVTFNTVYPAYTGGSPAAVELHFPERCLVRATLHVSTNTGSISVDAGSAHAEDGPSFEGTYVLEPDEPELVDHITIYGTNNTVQALNIYLAFCDAGE